MRVLVFGDSITQGFWDTEGGWVARLRKHYDERQLKDLTNNDEPVIFNLGISGDFTEGVIKRFENEFNARSWRWPNEEFTFIFAIGINDTITIDGKEWSRPERYSSELYNLIELAKSKSNKILFIGLTPVDESRANGRPGKPKMYNNERIILFDNALEKACQRNHVNYLKPYEKIKAEMVNGNKLFDDGLHPNNEGHELIFQLVQPELDKLL
jgi:lysophospholipase L1-like esterase